jgi:hypothetical protein
MSEDGSEEECLEEEARYLLANGVIVPPCKVGQICYKVYNKKILEVKVVSISYESLPAFHYTIRFNSIGVICLLQDGTRNEELSWDIYLTREEAEAKLKGGEG